MTALRNPSEYKHDRRTAQAEVRHCLRVYREPQTAKPSVTYNSSAVRDVLISRFQLNKLHSDLHRLRTEGAACASSMLRGIVAETTRLFGKNVTIYESFDPEFPDVIYTVLRARTSLPPEQMLQAELQWGKELARILPGESSIRLLVYPSS